MTLSSKFDINDAMFNSMAAKQSLFTELIEYCDWDENKASSILEHAITTLNELFHRCEQNQISITNKDELAKEFVILMSDMCVKECALVALQIAVSNILDIKN